MVSPGNLGKDICLLYTWVQYQFSFTSLQSQRPPKTCVQNKLWARPDTRTELTGQSDRVGPVSGLSLVLLAGHPVFSSLVEHQLYDRRDWLGFGWSGTGERLDGVRDGLWAFKLEWQSSTPKPM